MLLPIQPPIHISLLFLYNILIRLIATKYGTEEALFNLKWQDVLECPKCGNADCYKITSHRLLLYRCEKCGHQATATTDTIMQNSNLSLVKWFLTMYFVAQNKNSISKMSFANYLGVTLKTTWLLLHKIRIALGSNYFIYKLGGNVKMDKAF